MNKHDLAQKIRFNWKSGITVAFVSIPLSIALAIASGATPTQGIITAFWAGLLAAFLGGSNYNVTGPTGALSGILLTYAIVNGYAILPIVAIISGLIILAVWALKLDRYIIFIPKVVVHGFTLGVAFIIALGQLDNMLGLDNIPKTEKLTTNVWTSLQHYSEINWWIFLIFLIGGIFIFIWNKRFPKFPGAIIVALVGIVSAFIINEVLGIDFGLLTLADKYPDVSASLYYNIWGDVSLDMFLNKELWVISAATALIAILETLISGQIADNMTKTKFNRSKEVFALSIANIGSGVMGGIPATAALARTALNIKSGATDKISGVINAIFIAIISLLIFEYFKLLPMVAIASILIIVAINMVEKKHFITLMDNEKVAFFLSMFVAAITIIYDPIVGILTGSFFALMIFVNRISKGQTEIQLWQNWKVKKVMLKDEYLKEMDTECDFVVLKISGTLTYINMPAYLDTAKMIKGKKFVIISLKSAFYADSDGVSYLEEIVSELRSSNHEIYLTGVNKEIEKMLKGEEFYQAKIHEGRLFDSTSQAIDVLKAKC
jgi:SulP family sulfate permease